MKISYSKKSKAPYVITTLFTVIAIVVGIIVFTISSHNYTGVTTSSPTNLKKPTNEQIDDGKIQKDQTINSDAENQNKVPQVDITISTIKNGDTYRILTAINTITSEGTCKLKLQKLGETTIEKTVDVQAQPSNSVCKGFDIPLSDLGSGMWTITVNFMNNKSWGSATTTEQI